MKYNLENVPITFTPVPINEYEYFVPINEYYYIGIRPYYLISSFGRVFNKYANKFLSVYPGGNINNSRYICNLKFLDPDGKTKDRGIPIHRAMMISFKFRPDCDNFEVDHIDGVWYHNYLENLQWLPKVDNIKKSKFDINIMRDIYGNYNNFDKEIINV